MKRIVPVKNSVLCRKIDKKSDRIGNILYDKKQIDEYQILDFSSDDKFPFSIGDTVIVSANGDELECENETLYLFKTEHVIAKIDNI